MSGDEAQYRQDELAGEIYAELAADIPPALDAYGEEEVDPDDFEKDQELGSADDGKELRQALRTYIRPRARAGDPIEDMVEDAITALNAELRHTYGMQID